MLRWIRLRPLCTACFTFLTVSVISLFLPAAAKTVGVILCLLLLPLSALPRLRMKLPCFAIALSLLFAAAAFGLSHAFWDTARQKARQWLDEEAHDAIAIVREIETPITSLEVATLDLISLDGQDVSLRASLTLYGHFGFEEGDCIGAQLLFDDIGASLKEAAYSLSDGTMLSASLSEGTSVTILSSAGGIYRILSALHGLRRQLCNTVSYLFSQENAAFLSALLFGERSTLDASVTRDFRALGISHILAISGMHLAVLTGLLQGLLRRFLSPRATAPILIVLTWLFAAMIAFPASIVRAAVMLTFVHLSLLFRRDSDSLTALAAAGMLIVIFSPGALVDLSFQLSFCATLGLCVAATPAGKIIHNRFGGHRWTNRLLRYLLTSLVTTVSAVIFTIPVLFLSLGAVSAVCLPMSLLFIPPVTLLLTIAPIALLCFRLPLFGVLAIRFTGALSSLILYASRFFGQSFSRTLSLRYAFVFPLALLAAVGAVWILRRKIRPLFRLTALLTSITLLYFGCLAIHLYREKNVWYFDYINEGKNEALAIHREGFRLLCDLSDGSYSTLTLAAERLEAGSGLDQIDVVVLTHYDRRHITAFARLAAKHTVDTLCLPTPQSAKQTAISQQLASVAAAQGCNVMYYQADPIALLSFDGITLSVAEPQYLDRSVKPLLSLAVKAGNMQIFYTGSGVFESLQTLLFSTLEGADYLICGAYGPATEKDFTPELAISGINRLVCVSDSIQSHLQTALPVLTQELTLCDRNTTP